MAFKSLIIFALAASVGRVMTAPLAGLGARNPCSGILCARYVAGDGHSGLARRLAEFDGNNVTLSSASGGSSVNPSSTSVSLPLPTLSDEPSSTPLVGSPPTGSPSPSDSSINPNGTPQPTQPLANEPVTITVVSTVFLSPTDPAASLPTQSPALSNSVVSSSSGIDASLTVPGIPLSSVPPNPSPSVPADGASSIPSLLQPSGLFSSVSPAQPTLSATLIQLTENVPSSTVSSSSPADQPTPTPSGIIFLPPA